MSLAPENMEIHTKIMSLALLELDLWLIKDSARTRRSGKIAYGRLRHFDLEYRNAVFTIVFVTLENLYLGTSPILLSVSVLEISLVEKF